MEQLYICHVELTDGTVFTELVTSRTRVSPINGDTIPRLELLGALVLARLINSVLTAFEGTLRVDSVFRCGRILKLPCGGFGA